MRPPALKGQRQGKPRRYQAEPAWMLAVKPSGPRFHRSFVALFPGLPAGPLAAWPAGLRGGRLAVQPQPLGPLPVPTRQGEEEGAMAPRPDLDAVPRQSASRSPATATAARPPPAIARSYSAKNARHSDASPAAPRPPTRPAAPPASAHYPRRRTRHPRTVKLSPRPPSDPRPEPAARLPAGHPLRMPAAAFRHLSAWNRASGDLASNSRPQSGHAHTSITTSPAHSHRLAMLRHGTDPLS